MKLRLFYTTLLAATAVALTSCDKESGNTPEASQPQETQATPKEEAKLPESPSDEVIATAVTAALADFPFVSQTGTPAVDGALDTENNTWSATVRVPVVLKENLLEQQQLPEAFNEERKAINDAANKAMQPDSLYMLQIGAPTECITDEERASKPMPEDLQTQANALKDLADSSVYAIKFPAGMEMTLTITLKANYADEAWSITENLLDQAPLNGMSAAVAESALPEGANVLTPEFEQARKDEIQQKAAAFNEAAHAYILTREETARATFTERMAAAEEAARKSAEEAEAAAKLKEEWETLCLNAIAADKSFAGEWRRGNRFGEITIHIGKAERFDNSIQFIGTIFDTKLPEASLNIAGRCDLTPNADGTAHVDITIYDGQYDSDQPTAEVYDAQDGMLSLSLSKDGKLNGTMGCTAWGEKSEKNFNVSLSPKATTPGSRGRR